MEEPLWYQVLDFFEKNRYVRNGLTIPFLIGVSTEILQKEEKITIEQLLNDINSRNLPKGITIIQCEYIGEYILGILDDETKKIMVQYQQKNNEEPFKRIGGLLNVDGSINNILSSEDLSQEFSKKYKIIIELGKYSKVNGKWKPYTKLDKTMLNEFKNTMYDKDIKSGIQ